MKEMSRNDLLKRVEGLEKKVAELEGRVQEQPKVVQLGISNVNEFADLVNETIENLNKVKNFKFEITQSVK